MKRIQQHLQEAAYLKSIQALLHWDMETMMPPGAIEDRAKRLGYVQAKLHAHLSGPELEKLIENFRKQKKTKAEAKVLAELEWDLALNQALPGKHVEELAHQSAHATHIWAAARKANDLKLFLPHLQKLIDLKKREIGYYRFDRKRPYDALIKLHDKEFDSDTITPIFAELRDGLIDLARLVKRDGRFVKVRDPKGPFPVSDQKALSDFVARRLGLPEANSRLDVSVHPFSTNISPLDQRITTRYDEGHLDSLSSTMHEVGHALYEFNLPRLWEGTPFQEAVSLSVHESQSRFWENIIGRSREFAQFLLPQLRHHFPRAFGKVDEETLFLMLNKSVPGLIRVESSELYYNFHVIIRYEIEELIFNQGLKARDIPGIWKEKYQQYLGLSPRTDAEGMLQDSHWAGAAFGYFPTYTLGNLISGSLYLKMKKAIPSFHSDIRRGDFSRHLAWLKKHVHSHGRSVTSRELVGKLTPADYLAYLKEKFNV